jgi:soluble lytic murein transglycosylase
MFFSTTLIATVASAKTSESFRTARLKQAKELMGNRYKHSIVKAGEKVHNVRAFIEKEVKENLTEKFKKDSNKLANALIKEAKKYKFDPIFLMAVIDHESTFNPRAKGTHGEIGLMQIMPDTAEWIAKKYDIDWTGSKSLFDVATNVKIGAAYLDYLRGRFEAHGRLYLAAYNMGVTNVHRALDKEIWPKDYPQKVMQHYIKFYRALYTDPMVVAKIDPVYDFKPE